MNKISLKGLKEVLSDKELKEVMAGSGGGCTPTSQTCSTSTSCTSSRGYAGSCDWYEYPGGKYCACYES